MLRKSKWLVPLVSALLVLTFASPASAVTTQQKLDAMWSFSQTDVGSYNNWISARNNQGAWVDYAFNWSTDYCSDSPDNPLGFNFTLACARHDFGYRNYKEMGQFSSNKDRIDSAFYSDLKRKCAGYNWAVRPACYSLAWTYYQAVHVFGSIVVNSSDLAKAERLLPARDSTMP